MGAQVVMQTPSWKSCQLGVVSSAIYKPRLRLTRRWWLSALCVRKAYGNSFWLRATVENTSGVPMVFAVIVVFWQIYWMWPVLLRVEMHRCVNTRNPILWEPYFVGPVPFSVGPIWKWPCGLFLARRHWEKESVGFVWQPPVLDSFARTVCTYQADRKSVV